MKNLNSNNDNKSCASTSINWYPGHMAKTKRLIRENLNYIDIVYEVVDARIPFSSKISDIDDVIKNKPRILIMTKSDLCDLKETKKWINYYEEKKYKVILTDLLKENITKKIINITNELLKEEQEKRKAKGLKPRKTRAANLIGKALGLKNPSAFEPSKKTMSGMIPMAQADIVKTDAVKIP